MAASLVSGGAVCNRLYFSALDESNKLVTREVKWQADNSRGVHISSHRRR